MTTLKRSLTTVAFATSLLLAACGSTSSSSGSTSSSAGGSPGTGLAVVAREYSFDQKVYSVKPGTVSVKYTNRGNLSHTLVIDGVSGFKISLGPGQSKTASVTLPAGTYKMSCDVAGHDSLGMHAELDVQA